MHKNIKSRLWHDIPAPPGVFVLLLSVSGDFGGPADGACSSSMTPLFRALSPPLTPLVLSVSAVECVSPPSEDALSTSPFCDETADWFPAVIDEDAVKSLDEALALVTSGSGVQSSERRSRDLYASAASDMCLNHLINF